MVPIIWETPHVGFKFRTNNGDVYRFVLSPRGKSGYLLADVTVKSHSSADITKKLYTYQRGQEPNKSSNPTVRHEKPVVVSKSADVSKRLTTVSKQVASVPKRVSSTSISGKVTGYTRGCSTVFVRLRHKQANKLLYDEYISPNCKYRFDGLRPGTYEFLAISDKYLTSPTEKTIKIKNNTNPVINIKLTKSSKSSKSSKHTDSKKCDGFNC